MCIEELIEKFSKSLLKKNMGVEIPPAVSAQSQRTLISRYLKTKASYRQQLMGNMNALVSGKITQDEFIELQRQSIKLAYSDAYSLGKSFGTGGNSVLSDTERRFITYQVTKEVGFMSGFASDLLSQSGTLPYGKRMDMYVTGLDAVFGFGRLVYMPEDVQIIWKLGYTDKHCPDCLMFAKNNPYTKKTLPGYPKSGNSQCLSNCRCSLSYYYKNNVTGSEYDNFILSQTNTRKNIPTESEYMQFIGMKEMFFYNRLQYGLTKNPYFQNEYKRNLADIRSFSKNNNVVFPTSFPVKRQLSELALFKKNSKFQLFQNQVGLKEGQLIAVFNNGSARYGKIVSLVGADIQVAFLDKTLMSIDFKKSIIFGEI